MNIEAKMGTQSLYTLRILSNDTQSFVSEIEALIDRDAQKFHQIPVILEIVSKSLQANELAILVELLAQHEFIAVGIRSNKQELLDFAKFSGLAIFAKSTVADLVVKIDKSIDRPAEKSTDETAKNPADQSAIPAIPAIPTISIIPKTAETSILSEIPKTPEQQPPAEPKIYAHRPKIYRAPKIVSHKVYSFMQAYSKTSDLVLLNTVKPRAEVLAHGSIYAYKEVAGKVFAGISGDKSAIIFIHSFNAQLVSIAGIYKTIDVVPIEYYARSVVIDLVAGKLRFQVVE